MTYKLFDTMLQEHASAIPPRLVPMLPTAPDPDDTDVRELYMPPALHNTLSQVHPRMARDYAANTRAFLLRFVTGDTIDNRDYMKSWKADTFELRVQNQKRKDRLRIFGAFGKPDVFVAFVRKPRSYFGDRSDPKWDDIINQTVDKWEKYFPGCRRVPAIPFSNCLTSRFFDFNLG